MANTRGTAYAAMMVRVFVISGLLVLPAIAMAAVGAYSLWESGRAWYWWWLFPVCWGLAWLIAWGMRAQPPLTFEAPPLPLGTPRDAGALAIVQQWEQRAQQATLAELADTQTYVGWTQGLAVDVAKFYSPQSSDPLDQLNVLELMTAVQLASEDLADWVREHVPGSHWLTLGHWKLLSKLPGWYQQASQWTWWGSILINPTNLLRYAASKVAIEPLSRELQTQFQTAFASMYLRQLGFYLIELHSGRLKAGAKAYRAAAQQTAQPSPTGETLQVVVTGQVKAGKSSLVNALLRNQQAAVDVLPRTTDVQSYRLEWPATSDRLTLLDTPGYADSGLTSQQRASLAQALHAADVVLLVMDVRSPARQADVACVQALAEFYAAHNDRRPAPLIGVLTHIDGLSPRREWSPPYDLADFARPKVAAIREAIEYNREVLGPGVSLIAPVSLAGEQPFGVDEYVLPAMYNVLGTARGASLIRSLNSQAAAERWPQLARQFMGAGRQLYELLHRSTSSQS